MVLPFSKPDKELRLIALKTIGAYLGQGRDLEPLDLDIGEPIDAWHVFNGHYVPVGPHLTLNGLEATCVNVGEPL